MRITHGLLFVFATCVSSALAADTIYLRGGGSIEGRILAQSRQQVKIETVRGTRIVAKSKVRRIAFGEFDLKSARKRAAGQAADRRRKKTARAMS